MFDENALFELSEAHASVDLDQTPAGRENDRSNGSSKGQPAAKPYGEVDSKINLLFKLIRDLKSLANRACEAAVREAARATKIEETAGAELTALRLQLKEKTEALEACDRIRQERDAIAQEKIDRLEAALRDKEDEIEGCHSRARTLFAEIDGLQRRLNEVAGGMRQAEARFREFAEQQQGRITLLSEELEIKESLLQAKDDAMRQLVEESRLAIAALEERLQAVDAILQVKNAELQEQQAALQVNAANEKILAQLMQDLTVQSQALMAELCEKSDLVTELENRSHAALENPMVLLDSDLQEALR
jgi:hypothetical protein